MHSSKGMKPKRVPAWFAVVLVAAIACAVGAAGAPAAETAAAKKLSMVVGKSVVLKTEEPVHRVSIADPAVADFVLISPKEIYITGKTAGTTNMTLWQPSGTYRLFDLEVGFDVSRMKQRLEEILPEETDLRVAATGDSITLSGRVSNAANLSQVLALAHAHAPEGKVNNLVEIRGVQQVMLEVRVAEMQRSLARRMGVNFNYLTQSGKFGVTQLGGLTQIVSPIDANISSPAHLRWSPESTSPTGLVESAPFWTLVSPSVNALFRFISNGTTWTTFIDALKADGLVKVLAEPTLIALSGHSAYFHAGGEFPIPVPQGDGDITIVFKEYGVRLKFTPTVLADNKINIKVAPEVSELDFSTAVQFSGFVTPGLSTRKAETVVELADGQSFAIAGLLRDSARDVMSKYPLLGDIPILGALFRSRSYQRNETELVIIATPRLVKPLDNAQQTLPTDFYREPNDGEFYILGMMEGAGGGGAGALQGELDGEFGHAMPEKQ